MVHSYGAPDSLTGPDYLNRIILKGASARIMQTI